MTEVTQQDASEVSANLKIVNTRYVIISYILIVYCVARNAAGGTKKL